MPIELGGIDVLLGGKQAIDSSVAEDITFLERKIVVCGKSKKASTVYSDAKDFSDLPATGEIGPDSDAVGKVKAGKAVDITHSGIVDSVGNKIKLNPGPAKGQPVCRRVRVQWGPKGSLSGWITEKTAEGYYTAIQLAECYAPPQVSAPYTDDTLLRDAYYCAKEPLKLMKEVDHAAVKGKPNVLLKAGLNYTSLSAKIPQGVIFKATDHRPNMMAAGSVAGNKLEQRMQEKNAYVQTTIVVKGKMVTGWVVVHTIGEGGQWFATPMSGSSIVRDAGGGKVPVPQPRADDVRPQTATNMLVIIWAATGCFLVAFVLMMQAILG